MALVYTEQPDGTLSALEDDVLIVLQPLNGVTRSVAKLQNLVLKG